MTNIHSEWTGDSKDIFQAIINQLYHCEKELSIYDEICDKADQINDKGHGLFFGTAQVLCARSACLILHNIFDSRREHHTLANYKELIARIGDLKIRDRIFLEGKLAEWGFDKPQRKRMNCQEIIRYVSKVLLLKIKTEKEKYDFRKIEQLRNTGLAHGEMVTAKFDEFNYDLASSLLDFAHDLAAFFNGSFEDLYFEDRLCHRSYAQGCGPAIKRIFNQLGIEAEYNSKNQIEQQRLGDFSGYSPVVC